MKSFKKAVLLLVMTVALGLIPSVMAGAATSPVRPSKITYYLLPNAKTHPSRRDAEINTGVKYSEENASKIRATVRSSNQKVVKNSNIEIWKDADRNTCSINFRCDKKGTTTLSYQINGKKYKTKVVVKKYVNPVKSVVITGVTGSNGTSNAKLTQKENVAYLYPSRKKTKNVKVTFAVKPGWKIQNFSCYVKNGDEANLLKNYKSVSKATYKLGRLIGKYGNEEGDIATFINFMVYNPKEKGSIKISYNMFVQ